MRAAEAFEPIVAAGDAVDIARIIAATPYHSGRVMTLDFEEKYRATIEGGAGTCSERSFGLAWKLRRSDLDIQIVHLMRPGEIVRGVGHTVVRIAYDDAGETRVGLVDLLEGGLPTSGGVPLDIQDLTHGAVPDFRIRSFNDRKDEASRYYGDFLDGASIGFIPARELDSYFAFIESVYRPLGSERLEKLFFDGLALLLGALPSVYVPDDAVLVGPHAIEMRLQKAALWVLRSALLVIPGLLVFEIVARRRGTR